MTQDPLKELAQLTDALYQAELAKMRVLNEKEAGLRRDLAALEEHRRSNLALPVEQLDGVRQIGADILWQGWVGRTRADLNMRLAQVLAEKGHLMAQVKRAFGKQLAAAEMLEEAQHAKRQHGEKQRWQVMDDLEVLKSCLGPKAD